MNMPQINDFFIDKNRVDGITEEDYEQVQPKIEAVAAAARTTTNSIYIIDYHKRNFLYSSENPMLAPVGLKDMGYSLYIDEGYGLFPLHRLCAKGRTGDVVRNQPCGF